MAQSKIKYYQLDLALSIKNSDIAANAAIATAKLADGSKFFFKDGSIAATGHFNMGGFRVTNSSNPQQAQDLATKAYVDAFSQTLDIKDSVVAATTGNIVLSGTQTIDGHPVLVGNRVLVKNQTNPAENGIYVVSSGSWVRSSDANENIEVTLGLYTYVENGTDNGGNGWVLSSATNDPIVVGTTGITFSQFSGAGVVQAGTGMTKSGNYLNVETADASRIVVNTDNIDLATTGVAAAQYGATGGNIPFFTVDAYGRLTAAGNRMLVAGDIGAQPADSDLTAIASLTGTGYLVRTGTGTASTRSIVAVSNSRITISNGDGVVGNTFLDLAVTGVAAGTYSRVGVDLYGRVISGGELTLSDLPVGTLTTNSLVSKEPISIINAQQSYSLVFTPLPGTEHVYVNGVLQKEGAGNDYTISGKTILFLYQPLTTDTVQVTYYK